MIEMLIAMPMLIGLGFGVVEYGTAYWLKNTLQQVAAEGAREATESTATNSSVTAVVKDRMQMVGLDPKSTYTVTLSPADVSGLPTGTQISVTVTTTWGSAGVKALPTFLGGINSSKQFTASVAMNRE